MAIRKRIRKCLELAGGAMVFTALIWDVLGAPGSLSDWASTMPVTSRPLLVLPFQDRIEDGFGLIRTDTSSTVEMAVIRNVSDCGVGDAKQYAQASTCRR